MQATRFQDMPEPVIQKAKECFLDWVGVTLAGTTDPVAPVITRYCQSFGGRPDASILGTNIRTDCASAALANGVIGHALDFDDYHDETVIHASAACIPAILAVAERNGLSGEDFLAAMILGIDVCIRIGLGLGDYHYQRGWHTTATAGTFGATAGVARLLKLDVDQTVNAFGICGTQASGLRQVFGTMSKPFHAGKVSLEGVMSGFLAQGGFTSSKKIIEGDLGLLEVLTENANEQIILDRLGFHWYVNDPRLVRLRKKIETRLDPRIGFGARLRLIMKDGTEHNAFLSKPKGDPENPLSFDELAAKYRNSARLAVSDEAVGALIAAVKRMEAVPDMKEIVRLALKP